MTARDPQRRQRLLDAGDHLWLSRGYSGFSFADLAVATELAKPSVHHHFRTKEALITALIARHQERADAFFGAMGDRPAREAYEAFLSVYAGFLDVPDILCAAGTICADLHVLPDGVGDIARAYLASQEAWLGETLVRGGHTAGTDDLARTVLGALQGGLQRARATKDPDVLRSVLRSLAALPEWTPPSPERTPGLRR